MAHTDTRTRTLFSPPPTALADVAATGTTTTGIAAVAIPPAAGVVPP